MKLIRLLSEIKPMKSGFDWEEIYNDIEYEVDHHINWDIENQEDTRYDYSDYKTNIAFGYEMSPVDVAAGHIKVFSAIKGPEYYVHITFYDPINYEVIDTNSLNYEDFKNAYPTYNDFPYDPDSRSYHLSGKLKEIKVKPPLDFENFKKISIRTVDGITDDYANIAIGELDDESEEYWQEHLEDIWTVDYNIYYDLTNNGWEDIISVFSQAYEDINYNTLIIRVDINIEDGTVEDWEFEYEDNFNYEDYPDLKQFPS